MNLYQPFQHTLRKKITCEGIGVHSGDRVQMELCPAPVSSGIIFERVDLEGHNQIKARWDHVVDTMMCTRLANAHGVTIGTVEHLMAALFACGIDNAVVRVNSAELPIMDGSSEPFIAMIRSVGVVAQEELRRYIKIKETVTFTKNDIYATLSPADTLCVGFHFDFRGRTLFAPQKCTYTVGQDSFADLFSSARTFGILEEVNKLWDAGLAKGGSLENAVVVTADRVLNEGGLRFDDEFVRHKILDAVGDLYLAGPILGHFEAYNAGHGINNQLLRTLFAQPDAWEFSTLSLTPQKAQARPSARKKNYPELPSAAFTIA